MSVIKNHPTRVLKDFFAKKAVNSNKNIIFTPQSILNLSKKEYHYG